MPVLSAPETPAATAPLGVADLRAHFPDGRGYLSACTMGLPSMETAAALADDLALWQRAGATAARYDDAVARSRAAFAALVGVGPESVAVASQTSVFAGMVAASVPDGAEVLCVDGDFSSMVFPFLAQRSRGVTVRHAPLSHLAEAITDATWLVAFSLVQSATGEVADADSIREAAAAHGAFTLCDTTQAAGWLPVDASRFDATICHSFKWLCAPRGAAFLTVDTAFGELLTPTHACWYAGEDVWASCYGPQMALAHSARRFDASPAWPVWIGAAPVLELFAGADIAAVRDHDAVLGDALAASLGAPERGSAIVTWSDPDGSDLAALAAAGITASGRAGRARVAFHLWNDQEDVAAVLRAVGR